MIAIDKILSWTKIARTSTMKVALEAYKIETHESNNSDSNSIKDDDINKATLDTLNDDTLYKVLEFVGKTSYAVFGLIGKRYNVIFDMHELPKHTDICTYAPLKILQTQRSNRIISRAAIIQYDFNRKDVLDWAMKEQLTDLLCDICELSIRKQRIDILSEVFFNDRLNNSVWTLGYLRDSGPYGLLLSAARNGQLECLKWLREHGKCEWDDLIWKEAKINGHVHILDFLRHNGYPHVWQYE